MYDNVESILADGESVNLYDIFLDGYLLFNSIEVSDQHAGLHIVVLLVSVELTIFMKHYVDIVVAVNAFCIRNSCLVQI